MTKKIYVLGLPSASKAVIGKVLRNTLVSQIARRFSAYLYDELGETFFKLAEQTNTESQHCYMQDECDANMIMYAALSDCTQGLYSNATDQDALDLSNDAWKVAKQNKFFIESMQSYIDYKS